MLLFWIACALLTVFVVLALAHPMLARRREPTSADEPIDPDTEIYRDQLREIDADTSRGLLSGPEAEAARTEVARRLLARAEAFDRLPAAPSAPASPGSSGSRMVWALAVVVPAMSLGLYLALGSPGLATRPTRPTGATLQADGKLPSIAALVAQVEQRLRHNPSDGRGWDVIAPVYLRMGRFQEAAGAFQNAIRILGETPKRLIGFAEATVLGKDGIVTEPARKAYARVLAVQPDHVAAQFGLALAAEQDGDLDKAAAAYQAMLATAPAAAPWRQHVSQRLTALQSKQPSVAPATTDRGQAHDDEASAAIAELPKAQRQQAIVAMVEGLATRLKSDGRDVDGWLRLMRSWTVLGQTEKAEAALQAARKALAGNPAALTRINSLAKSLGLKS